MNVGSFFCESLATSAIAIMTTEVTSDYPVMNIVANSKYPQDGAEPENWNKRTLISIIFPDAAMCTWNCFSFCDGSIAHQWVKWVTKT
jgi:hypothetical protein